MVLVSPDQTSFYTGGNRFVAYTVHGVHTNHSTVLRYMLHEVFNNKIQNFSLIWEWTPSVQNGVWLHKAMVKKSIYNEKSSCW